MQPIPNLSLIETCWIQDPKARPTSKSILKSLRKIDEENEGHIKDAALHLLSSDEVKVSFSEMKREEALLDGDDGTKIDVDVRILVNLQFLISLM